MAQTYKIGVTEEKSMRSVAMICGATFLALVSNASAQSPAQPMRMIVPATAGGSSDILGRLIAEHLQQRLGQTMITENRPGAGQAIGSAHVAQSPPNGQTLLLATVSYTTNAAIYTKLPYDPVNALVGVAMVGSGPLLVTVHPSLPVKSIKELIAVAKARPGGLNFGSAGTGTIPHLAGELFAGSAKVDIVHVPYKSITPAVTATVAGEVPLLFGSTPSSRPDGQGGPAARPRRHHRETLVIHARAAHGRGSGRSGLRRGDVVGRAGARGNAQTHGQQAQQRDPADPCARRREGPHRRAGRGAGARHVRGRFHRASQDRDRQVAQDREGTQDQDGVTRSC